MGTFPRGVRREDRILAARFKRMLRPGVAVEIPEFVSKLPGDPIALRGIPAIGRGVGGAIRGSRPEDCLSTSDKAGTIAVDSPAA